MGRREDVLQVLNGGQAGAVHDLQKFREISALQGVGLRLRVAVVVVEVQGPQYGSVAAALPGPADPGPEFRLRQLREVSLPEELRHSAHLGGDARVVVGEVGVGGAGVDDAEAVAVVFHNDEDGDDYCIGYIPCTDNEVLAKFLGMGWGDIFECRISKINPDAHPEHQIYLTIKIIKNVS